MHKNRLLAMNHPNLNILGPNFQESWGLPIRVWWHQRNSKIYKIRRNRCIWNILVQIHHNSAKYFVSFINDHFTIVVCPSVHGRIINRTWEQRFYGNIRMDLELIEISMERPDFSELTSQKIFLEHKLYKKHILMVFYHP